MDYEKAYKDALERAKSEWVSNLDNAYKNYRERLENIFPKIKESEDEKMIGRIIKALQRYMPTDELLEEQEIVAWLEKQGEHKAANKVEPKFKVGDWITIDNPCQIISVNNENYIVQYCDDEKTHMLSKRFCDSYFHLWTIQDAKDGDGLVASDGSLFIFAKVEDTSVYHHFSLCKDGSKEISDGSHAWETANSCHPATKEQRDLLFSKMREAGYEWDNKKKEVRKIEDGIEIPFSVRNSELQEVTYYIPKDFYAEIDDNKVVIKKSGNPIAWSKEDENFFVNICSIIDADRNFTESAKRRCKDWIKSLKQRMEENVVNKSLDEMVVKGLNNKWNYENIMQMLQSIYEVLVSINNKNAPVQIVPYTPPPLEPFYDTSKPFCNTTNKIEDNERPEESLQGTQSNQLPSVQGG